jgi:hypothetical protein
MFARFSTVILYVAALLVSTVIAITVPPPSDDTTTIIYPGHVSLAPHQNLIMLTSWYNLFRIMLYLGPRCQTLSSLACEPGKHQLPCVEIWLTGRPHVLIHYIRTFLFFSALWLPLVALLTISWCKPLFFFLVPFSNLATFDCDG